MEVEELRGASEAVGVAVDTLAGRKEPHEVTIHGEEGHRCAGRGWPSPLNQLIVEGLVCAQGEVVVPAQQPRRTQPHWAPPDGPQAGKGLDCPYFPENLASSSNSA